MSLQVLVGPRKAEEGPSETTWVSKVSLLRGPRKEASALACLVPSTWALEPIVAGLGVGEEPEVLMCVFPIARDTGASRKARGGGGLENQLLSLGWAGRLRKTRGHG